MAESTDTKSRDIDMMMVKDVTPLPDVDATEDILFSSHQKSLESQVRVSFSSFTFSEVCSF